MTFRRRNGTETWHFCRNCSQWPVQKFDEQTTKPTEGLCPECEEKEKAKRCQQ